MMNNTSPANSDEHITLLPHEPSSPPSCEKNIPANGNASPLSVIFNVSNSTIGAGILAIPYAFHQSGILLGCTILILVCIVTTVTSIFLLRACEISHGTSYKAIGMKAFNNSRIFSLLNDTLMIIFCFGVMLAYTSIAGDYLSSLWKLLLGDENILHSKNFNCFLVTLFMTLPLSCLRRIGFLSYTSYLSILCVVLTLCVILVGFIRKIAQMPHRHDYHITLVQDGANFFQVFVAFPVLFFSFGNTVTLIPIYYELKHRSMERMIRIVVASGLICLLCYLFAGIFGYVQFGDGGIKENILNAFRGEGMDVVGAKVCMVVVSVASYPLIHFPARQTIDALLFPGREFSWVRWVGEAVVLAVLVVLTLLIPFDLVTIFGLTGRLCVKFLL